MAAKTSHDELPTYESKGYQALTTCGNAGPSTTPTRKPGHSTRASQLWWATFEGISTMSQYLELTFSVMVQYRNSWGPVVIAIDEDYDTLLDDFHHMFVEPKMTETANMPKRPMNRAMPSMTVQWEKGYLDAWVLSNRQKSSVVHTGNIIALLRLLKSQSGMNFITIDQS